MAHASLAVRCLSLKKDSMDSASPPVEPALIGVVTSSDRASRGEYEDRSGPAIEAYLTRVLATPFVIHRRLVEDEQSAIESALRALADDVGCCLVVTTGGTGPAPRDVTPEATVAVCDRLLPGFGEQMRAASLAFVPTAILSRQLAGTRGRCMIINLPGKPKAIAECLDAVFAAVPYGIDLIGGPRLETRPEVLKAFRPKGA
jgi:molybdopterin adenylyltransferase